MTAFSYVTGNPANLSDPVSASMTDIAGPFTDLKAFLNGGTINEGNLPNLAAAFTTYKQIARGRVNLSSVATSGNVYGFDLGPIANNARIVDYDIGVVLIDLDPTEFAANSRVTKLRCRLSVMPNNVASAVTFTVGLYPVTTYAGAPGVAPSPGTPGTVVAGSTAAIVSPPALTRSTVVSGDFNFPAAGSYALGVTVSGSPAAGSISALVADVSMRQV